MRSLVFVLLIAAPTVATEKPLDMTANGGIRIDLAQGIGYATGDVVVKRDDVTVCCDKAEAHYSEDRIEKVVCSGRVVILRPNGTRATADQAVFVAAADALTLSGSAEVLTKEARLRGPQIVYDIKKDELTVLGGRGRFDYKTARPKTPKRSCPPS